MRAERVIYWRRFLELCEKLELPHEDVKRLLSRRGAHQIGGFTLRIEGMVEIKGYKLPLVSLWKTDQCYYKSPVNPYLFDSD